MRLYLYKIFSLPSWAHLPGPWPFLSLLLLALVLQGTVLPARAMAGPDLPDPLAGRLVLERLSRGTMRNFVFPKRSRKIADIVLYDEKGKQQSLMEWRGTTLLLNFWAPWCEPCRRELPALERLRMALDGQKFEIVLVNIDHDVKRGANYLDRLGVSRMISRFDRKRDAFKKMGGTGVPTSVLVDCHGRELGRLKGSADWQNDDALLLVKTMMRKSGCYDEKRDML